MPNTELSPEAFARVTRYANIVGITTDEAVSKIVSKWMDETGDLLLSFLDKKDRAKQTNTAQVLSMPERIPSTIQTPSKRVSRV